MPRKCAFGCESTGITLHVFPNPDKDPERFRAWVNSVNGRLETPSDYEYFRKKRVCDLHFKDHDRNRFNRLNALAVPSPIRHSIPESEISQQVITNMPDPVPSTSCIPESDVSLPVIGNQPNPVPSRSCIPESDVSQPVIGNHPNPVPSRSCIPEADVSQPVIGNHPNPVPSRSCIPESDVCQPVIGNHPNPVPSRSCIPESDVSQPVIGNQSNPVRSRSWEHLASSAVAQEHNYCKSLQNNATKKKKWTFVASQKGVYKNLQNKIRRLKKRGASFKSRLEIAEKIETSLQKVTKNMSKPAQIFMRMQFKGCTKKSKGRRFTLPEKVMSLSLYKRSPKCYSLLSQYFTLPSPKTMKRLLSEVKVQPGINKIIFEKIKNTTSVMDKEDRLCSLIFDEMSITPNINYDPKNDCLKGFADYGKNVIADHALVFMVKGIRKNYKQPVAYYFTSNMLQHELKQIIKDVVVHVQKSGLIILCTVCDQSAVNVSAINGLVKETKEKYLRKEKQWQGDIFEVGKKKIIPIYDVPHLIKGLRNNLLTKDMKYQHENKEHFFKWEYIQMLYAADKLHGELRLAQKLTEEHVNPEKIKKMRVKTATQVFSHSVAVAAEHLTARGNLSEDCKQIIPITLLLDNLFDSLNCNTFTSRDGKIYKGAVKKNSPHHHLWVHAKKMLNNVKFIEKKKEGTKIRLVERTVPSVYNFIKTIEGMEAIWKILSQKYGIDTFFTRNCNQDPIENFFGNIRSYGVRNVAPNSISWEGAFKALLLNNYNSPHSIHSNCEEDTNSCLQALDFFVKNPTLVSRTGASGISEEPVIHLDNDILLPTNYENDSGQRNYVCGWVLTKCLKNIVKKCIQCRKKLIETDESEQNAFIKAKEYYKDKKWLCYPSKDLVKCFHDIQHCTTSYLKTNVPKNKLKCNIKLKIKLIVETLVECPFQCKTHKDALKEYFVDTTINVLIFSWCRSINRILAGKIKYDGEDELKLAAQVYYNKHKHFNK